MGYLRWISVALALGAVSAWALPELTAKSAYVLDARSGRPLFAKNEHLRHPPASTTKVLTALVVLQKCGLEEGATVPPEAKTIEGSSFHLQPSEVLKVKDLLYALMLRSGNDAAHTLAVHTAGSDEAFADLMNAEAARLGCTDSYFANPHGLPNPSHLTSAHDLALIGRAALEDPTLAAVVRTRRRWVDRGAASKDTLLINRNSWLSHDPSAIGVKTGRTNEAGQCFVGAADREAGKIVTALLGSTDWLKDQQVLVSYVYSEYRDRIVATPGVTVAEVPVDRGEKDSVKVGVKTEVGAMATDRDKWVLVPPPVTLRAPVREGQVLGVGKLRDGGGFEIDVEVVTVEAVEPSFLWRFGPWLAGCAGAGAIGLGLRAVRARRTP